MIKADVPLDVTEYKEKFFFGVTTRTFLSIVAMIAIVVPTFLLLSKFMSQSIAIYICVFISAPAIGMAMPPYNGMYIEKLAVTIFDFYAGVQRRKPRNLPDEIAELDLIRKWDLEFQIIERKAELRFYKQMAKAEKKLKKKNRRKKDKNADNNSNNSDSSDNNS